MGLGIAIGLAAAVLAVLVLVLGLPKRGWEVVGAALLLGLAGYSFQGSPGQAGAPRQAEEKFDPAQAEAVVAERQKMSDSPPMSDRFLVTAEAFMRNGDYGYAAEYLRGVVRRDRGNSEAWLTLANALVSHAEGNLSPAALYAFRQARQAEPQSPGPPFFLGLALAQSGRLEEGRALWAQALAESPADAPWREELAARLAQLDAFIARQSGNAPAR